ncbi:Rhodopsin, GQ-coupled [Holothuria leucospilota]|uniref:Rhodopsin, GQ-coupled n=1 Tax=Holothuria leucospilota TaxID=206669 RepID=A0A9Q1CG99_HOLLE|nr:Rhodopsin, GQ-coupled [Holothuria leucospilota]
MEPSDCVQGNCNFDQSTMIESYTVIESTQMQRMEDGGYQFNDPIQRRIIASITSIVSAIGLTGNTLVIVAVIFSKKLQTKTNVFVVNLALADVLTCSLLPFQVLALSVDSWPLPDWICAAVGLLTWICLWTSNINLALIALNRYNIVIKTKEDYENMYTTFKMALWVIFSWVLPTLLMTVPVAFKFGAMGYSSTYKVCTVRTVISNSKTDWYGPLSSVIIKVPSLIIITVSYSLIFRHIRRHSREMLAVYDLPADSRTVTTQDVEQGKISQAAVSMQRHLFRRQHKITKNLFTVFCSFVVCVMPFGIACLFTSSYPIMPWVSVLILLNSSINPIIYGLKHPNFKEVFRPLLFCRWRKIPQPSKVLTSVIEGRERNDRQNKL